ncbi:protein-disulfide reductase DsbD [Parashewanella curva]|uniref:Thiol:disulfide interchange protein DsbD n=1 Tax=Parashewanella curva TaxID=2338552 RepID=A0A3L8PW24_9GAMM|nr:protein-disulfide reductase DsbD [Parashewanella curva]RLV59534.1 protein-disulfide reductase DsbD [Parashewanella curva]
MKKLIHTFFALFISIPLGYSLTAQAGIFDTQPELLPVEKAFDLEANQAGDQLKLNWVIDSDGYYMYKDKLKFSIKGAQMGAVLLPKGKMHHDEYFGDQEVYTNFLELSIPLKDVTQGATFSVTFMGCAEGRLCYPPTTRTIDLKPITSVVKSEEATTATEPANKAESKPVVSEQDSLSQLLSNNNLWLTLLIFFGLGVGLALTPCVFPMYPILSGIIVGQGKSLSYSKGFALSMVYVQGMAITYSILGLIVASAGLKYQAALQQPAVLIGIALLFIVLSLSMFGLYDLKLPSKWQEKMNAASNNQKGGNFLGVFVMGAISGLVASPCTSAPLSGVLIYIAQTGDLVLGFFALYILSMGMGLPLLIMGTSGGKLLPRAGGWMNIIKTVFGFLLISVAIMMLSRIWSGVVIDVIWALWGIALTGYLLHENRKTEHNWKHSTRAVLLAMCFMGSFSYGFQSVMFKLGFIVPVAEQTTPDQSKGFIKVKTLSDLQQELTKAKAANKAVMVDFYADWCVACKEFEHITFADTKVKERMDNMVLIQADVTKNDDDDIELLENYDVYGLPTLIFFDTTGKIRDEYRVTGFMKPEPFTDHLDLLLK